MGERVSSALLVAVGGALGALLRFGTVQLTRALFGVGFPLGTLVVNGLGCLAAGLVAAWLEARGESAQRRAFLAIGLLGGFTTFSAFGVETLALLREGRTAAALGYVALSLACGLGGVALGLRLAR
jgi:CrcB protein